MSKVKITFEITKIGYIETVTYEGKTFKTEHVRTDFGAESTGPDLESQGCPDFIHENLGDPYDIMWALRGECTECGAETEKGKRYCGNCG